MPTKMKFIFLLFFTSCAAFSQNKNRAFIDFKPSKSVIEINVSDGKYIIKSYSNNIVETSFIPTGETLNPISHAVVIEPIATIFKIKVKTNIIALTSNGINISIQKSPFQITYFNKQQPLLSEKEGFIKNDSTHKITFNLLA